MMRETSPVDDTESEHMNDDAEETTHPEPVDPDRKPAKPRGQCTGCDFDYQLGTARTGEHKGELVIRKHNSRVGPGLCSGAQRPPEPTYEELEGAARETALIRVPDDVVGADDPETVNRMAAREWAEGGTPIVTDPWTAPASVPVAEGDVSDETSLGPWVTAGFDGDCDGTSCGGQIVEGDKIRADGEGGWLCEPCGEDAEIVKTTVPPVSISEVHAENPPRVTVVNSFTAPAPASDIPESTTTVSGQPEPDRDRWGRYLILGTAHTRATTFAKLGANTKAIEAWNERNVIRGLTLRPDLLMLANGLEVKRDRDQLNSIAAQAKDAAGSKVAANIGTAYHAFSERLDAGLIGLDDVPYQYQPRVYQYRDAIKRAGLTTRPEWIERTTAVRADQVGAPLPVAGTLDRIFQLPDGSLVIGDLKTGSDLSYGEMEIEVQLALYAHGVNTHGLFDWNTKTWQPLQLFDFLPGSVKVRTDIAIVVHLPADGDGCTLYVADIERGWRDAQRLGGLQASLKDKPKGKRFRTLMASDLAPRPGSEPVIAPPCPAPARTGLSLGGFGGDYVQTLQATAPEHIYDDGHGGLWQHPGWLEDCTTPECVAGRTGFQIPGYVAARVPSPEPTAEQYMAATAYHPTNEAPVIEPPDSHWEHAKHLFSTAPDQAAIAQLYQFAMDSGKFHQDQLAVLVGLGKDRLNALARA